MDEIMLSTVSPPMEINNKSKFLCENELEMLINCKKDRLEYCFLFEDLYKDCLKFKKNKEEQKKEKKIAEKKN
tara:strand:- start:737 stop:955 length:219 start_codon:yes stop_codon:yes gene_type:complete